MTRQLIVNPSDCEEDALSLTQSAIAMARARRHGDAESIADCLKRNREIWQGIAVYAADLVPAYVTTNDPPDLDAILEQTMDGAEALFARRRTP